MNLTLPAALTSAQWDKQAGAAGKTSPVADSLKTLGKLFAAIDTGLLDVAKLKTADAVRARIEQVDGSFKKQTKSASDHCGTLAALARKSEAELKKNPAAKAAANAAAAVARAAADFSDQLVQAQQALRADLVATLAKLEAQEKKEQPDAEADSADVALVRSRVVSAMRTVKAAKPEGRPVLFMLAVGAKECLPYLAHSVGASHKTMLTRLLADSAGARFHRGDCIWEAKAYTFVGDTLPTGGFAKRLQKGLLDLTGVRYPVRVRRTDGEVDAVEGDEAAEPGSDFDAERALLEPLLQRALRASPAQRTALMGVWEYAVGQALAGDIKKALDALTRLKKPIADILTRAPQSDAQKFGIPQGNTAQKKEALQAYIESQVVATRQAAEAEVGLFKPRLDQLIQAPQQLVAAVNRSLQALLDEVRGDLNRSLQTGTQAEVEKAVEAWRARLAGNAVLVELRKSAAALRLTTDVDAQFKGLLDGVKQQAASLAA